jgi:peroxiredoxin Q/BCP
MVELRKRKAPAPPPVVRPAKKKAAPKSKVAQAKEAVIEKVEAVADVLNSTAGASNGDDEAAAMKVGSASAPKLGDTISLAGYGGEVETHEGVKTTLAKLVEESKAGVVLFTYPKASTPGCE